MDRSLKYFLSLLTGLWVVACQPQQPKEEVLASPEERLEKAERFRRSQPQYYQGARYRQAIFDTLIQMAPSHEYYYRQKSITHSKIGDYHLAFPLLEKAAELNPSEALYYYGWLLLYMYRDYPRALQRLEEFDQLTPGQMDYAWGENVYFLKGLAHKQRGNHEQAVAEFTRSIEAEGLDKVDVYTFVYRGITYLQMGKWEQAIQDFDQSLQLYPRCTMAHYYKGEALLKQGKREAALGPLQSARELLEKGIKKTDPYFEVFDEIHPLMIEDLLKAY